MSIRKRAILSICAVVVAVLGLSTAAYAVFNYFQGFETGTGDWVASQGITRVPSGGGTLNLSSSEGSFHAEIQNLHDGYTDAAPGFGDAGYSFYGGGDSVYHGAFFQSIDVYINANWTPATYSWADSFWIDMTPYHADPANYGAEHNFHVKALGSSVQITVDGQTTPIATITQSGWYTFLMTWRKAANSTDPVITDMKVLDSGHNLLGSAEVPANSPGGPFESQDLAGNGYVWITLWQNGFAGDVLAIDNQRTGLLGSNGDGLTYSCAGFQPPMDKPVSVKKQNRVLPLTMVCTDSGGNILGSSNIPAPIVQVVKTNPTGDSTVPAEAYLSAGQGTDGNQFVFDPVSQTWKFNLQTKNFTGSGNYTISAVGGVSDVITPAPTGTFVVQ